MTESIDIPTMANVFEEMFRAGPARARGLLKKFSCSGYTSHLPPDKRAEFIAALQAATGGDE